MKTQLKRSAWTAVVCLLAFAPGISPARAEVKRDPRAVAIVDAMVKVVAPDGAWDKIAGLRFTQVYRQDDKVTGEFRHIWDLKTGRFRVEGKGENGGERIVIFDIPTGKGEGWVQLFLTVPPQPGEAPSETPEVISRWMHPPGPPQKAYLKFGHERYLNDTYWLLFPMKLKDQSVELAYEGEQALDGDPHDVIKAVFPHELGLSTGDTYWLFINRKSHLIDRWDYVQPPPPEPPPVVIKSLVRTKNPPPPGSPEAALLAARASRAASKPKSGESQAPTQPGTSTTAGAAAAVRTPSVGSEKADTAPTNSAKKKSWLWKDWDRSGPLLLSTVRYEPATGDTVTFEVEVLSSVPPKAFETPTKPREPALAASQDSKDSAVKK